ncbi:MAG: hypothetical protein M1358_12135, partial [Chloroflexi bacterium]|nr:hypothetical protein [Chloroflexota bacterium]
AVGTACGDKGQAKTKEVFYPGDLRDCKKCHDGQTYSIPLPANVLPMAVTSKGQAGKTVPPITAACSSCHADSSAAGHFELNTTQSGTETCAVCHGQNADFNMDKVHSRP